MKFLIILALAALAVARPDSAKPDYSRYENYDVDEVIDNKRFLLGFAKCFEGTGKCTAESGDFKKWIPDAVQSDCGECSEHQKTLVARVMKAIIEKLPEEWEKLDKIYNPDGKFSDGIKKFIEKYGHKE